MKKKPDVRDACMDAAWDIGLTDTTVVLAPRAGEVSLVPLAQGAKRLMPSATPAGPEWDHARLVRDYFARSVRFCARMLGDANEGEEVAQAAFVRMLEQDAKPWQGGAIEPFLFRSLRNACIDHIRRRKVRMAQGSLEAVASTPDPDRASDAELREAVLAAIATLEEAQREVILLRFFEGLSLSDTARAVGRSVGAVAMLLTRAKERLRDTLARNPDFKDMP